jgi:tetratricopeptide (TPR) repeat protein
VDGGRLYATGTWKPGPQLGPGTPWDATAELVVMGQADGIYRLVELDTGREVARLEDPEQSVLQATFSPDGTKLVLEARNGLRVWDLRRIRAELAEMGLDWKASSYPPVNSAKQTLPLSVTVNRGEIEAVEHIRQADLLCARGDLVGAIGALQKAHTIAPGDAFVNHYLAWLLAICPDPKVRDPKQAVKLAKLAVASAPDQFGYQRALGIAHYYAGDYQAAVEALTRSVEQLQGGHGYDHFPLAMAYNRKGDKEEARKWYDRGVAWMNAHKQPPRPEKLAILRADAEALLGIQQPSPDKSAPEKKE